MANAMNQGFRHPLDVDLADFAGDLVEVAQREAVEEHLGGCLLCRIKVRRLRGALGQSPETFRSVQSGGDVGGGTIPTLGVKSFKGSLPLADINQRAPGQLWTVGNEERLLVLVAREGDGRVFVVPVTFDALAADDETIVVEAELSPFEIPLALYPMLATELPERSLATCIGQLVEACDVDRLLAGTLVGTAPGQPIDGPTDPRLEFRQMLAEHLATLEEILSDPDVAADAPPPRPERLASDLGAKLRDLRGLPCKLYRLRSWEGVTLAYSKGWIPVASVDELGTVLVVFDTGSGLSTSDDFNAAISILTRYNATAVVVLATTLSPNAELFDAASLSYGISVPSGETSPPAPLLSGLAPADTIAKFLDRNSSWSEGTSMTFASITSSDVSGTLSRSAASAIKDMVDQGRRAKIKAKAAGYTSVEDLSQDLEEVLRGALAGDPVAQRLSELADRRKR